MDALKLLREDHKRIKQLLDEGEDNTPRGRIHRDEVFEHLRHAIEAHERREEEVLYPALETHEKAKSMVLEGYEEHHLTGILINEISATPYNDARWSAKFKVLKDMVEHHLAEEEHELFKTARHVFNHQELDDMGDRMAMISASAMRT